MFFNVFLFCLKGYSETLTGLNRATQAVALDISKAFDRLLACESSSQT